MERIDMIPTDLFQFAYIPSWYEQLYELSQLAAPKPWRFRQPTYETQNIETPILERYINQVFRKQAIDYSCAPEGQAGRKGVQMTKIIRCPRCNETLFFLCVGGSLPT